MGKTFVCAVWEIAQVCRSKSKIHPWWWLAPTYNQVVQGYKLVLTMADTAGILKGSVKTPYPILTFLNDVQVEFRSWDREQNLMGTSIAGAVVDEAGLLDPKSHAAISTRRSSTLGPIRYIGNPGLIAGPFRKICMLGEDAENVGINSLHKWTWRDKFDALFLESERKALAYKAFIEQERKSLPEFEFRRLYEAEWTEDEAAVFRGVRDVVKGEHHLGVEEGRFVIGVDVAQVTDYLCAVSMDQASRRIELRERFRGISYPQAAVRLKALHEALDAPLIVEVNGPGIALVQELQRLNVPFLPFTTTNQSKQEIVMNLAADIQNKTVELGDHAPMPYEFEMFRYDRTPSGLYRYSAPPGEHDDTVMAAALARWGVSRAVGSMGDYGWVA